jgi:hypothetical protein
MGLGTRLLVFFLVTTGLLLWIGSNLTKKVTEGVPIIDSPAGRFQGSKELSRDGRDIFAYRGTLTIVLISSLSFSAF